jgi:diadenosine tetraphosphate (Ap4A) HIT family hydrolase
VEDWKKDRLGSCERGENPTLIARMGSGFAVIGDNQFLPGYCLLLRSPRAVSLNELSRAERERYLLDMTLLGDAILMACRPLRINYMTLMNLDHFLHTHVEPRYDWEQEPYRSGPGFLYPGEIRFAPEHEYSEKRHGALKREIAACLRELTHQAGLSP